MSKMTRSQIETRLQRLTDELKSIERFLQEKKRERVKIRLHQIASRWGK